MADRSKCPNCGEPVSPYAAGCAVCGADLDTRRWDTGPTAARRAGSAFNAFSMGNWPTWFRYAMVALVIVIVFGLYRIV